MLLPVLQVRKSNDGELVNGIDSLGIEDDSHLLSSSLEAEQRYSIKYLLYSDREA